MTARRRRKPPARSLCARGVRRRVLVFELPGDIGARHRRRLRLTGRRPRREGAYAEKGASCRSDW